MKLNATEKTIIAVAAVFAVAVAGFWVVIADVAIHFIIKFW